MSTPEPVATEKSPKTYARTLRYGRETMEFRNEIKSDGTVRSRVIVRLYSEDGKTVESTDPGAYAEHANIADAKAAMAKLIAEALKKGWEKPKAPDLTAYHFKQKPEAFPLNALPAPRNKK